MGHIRLSLSLFVLLIYDKMNEVAHTPIIIYDLHLKKNERKHMGL